MNDGETGTCARLVVMLLPSIGSLVLGFRTGRLFHIFKVVKRRRSERGSFLFLPGSSTCLIFRSLHPHYI